MAEVPIRGEFPSNSNRPNKPRPKMVTSKPAHTNESASTKLLTAFFAEDLKSVGAYLLWDVVVPAAKNGISDLMSQGVDRLLFGGDARPLRSSQNGSYTSYGRVYRNNGNKPGYSPGSKLEVSKRIREGHRFEELVLDSRTEAESVIENLTNIAEEYGSASVGDLYGMVGISSEPTDENWGWTDLRGASVARTRQGYSLDLPKVEDIRDA